MDRPPGFSRSSSRDPQMMAHITAPSSVLLFEQRRLGARNTDFAEWRPRAEER